MADDRRGTAPLLRRLESWQGRRVWLIGASDGIGRELARLLAADGARLAVSARRADEIEALARELGPEALALPVDATDQAALTAAAARLEAAWGAVDHVIYTAGIYWPMGIDTFDVEKAAKMIEVNLTGGLRVTAAALPLLERGNAPQLALTASASAYRGLPRAIGYGASKAGLCNLAETLAVELAPRGIDVRVVNPGFVRTRLTDMNDFRMPAMIEPEAAARAMRDGLASRRFHIHFPKRFTGLLVAARILPSRWWLALSARMVKG
ncbi:SDR family NAD(P)-dependent oxidoreductase [Tistrella mobilis]|uniref:SDR family NAD(P)-dependent oxidoreductase n=1 Tax=Tistrella mobilis TaxID=171437 RepID=UPI0035590753